jgi:hypothetical protein
MYESYSRQSIPERHYRELLGSAICVFNQNNSFIIENILCNDEAGAYNWYDLIDLESGKIKAKVKEIITSKFGDEVEKLFSELIVMRNRIIHSFQITKDGQQILATKIPQKDGGNQFVITEDYLLDFIKQNEKLSDLLHKLRGF